MDVDDVSARANSEAECDKWGKSDNGVEGDHERLVFAVKLENTVAGNEKENENEGHFGKTGENAERKSFGVTASDFGATVNKPSNCFGEPEFSGGTTFVIKKPHDDSEGDENTDSGSEELYGESSLK